MCGATGGGTSPATLTAASAQLADVIGRWRKSTAAALDAVAGLERDVATYARQVKQLQDQVAAEVRQSGARRASPPLLRWLRAQRATASERERHIASLEQAMMSLTEELHVERALREAQGMWQLARDPCGSAAVDARCTHSSADDLRPVSLASVTERTAQRVAEAAVIRAKHGLLWPSFRLAATQ